MTDLTPAQAEAAGYIDRLEMSLRDVAQLLRLNDPENNGATTVRRWIRPLTRGGREPSGPVLVALAALASGWRDGVD